MRKILISAIGLWIVTLVLYLINMFRLMEIVFLVLPIFPIYLYKSHSWSIPMCWSISMFVGVISRMVAQYIMISNGIIIEKPIDLSNRLVLGFSGMGIMVGYILYSVILLVYCCHRINKDYKNITTIEEARNSRRIRNTSNFYSTTIFMLVICITITTVYYGVMSMWINSLVFVLVLISFNIGYNMFSIDCCRRACSRIYDSQQ